MVLGKLPVPGRPTNLDYNRARAYCPCSRCGWGLFGHFYSHLSFSPLSPSLWETARYRLKYCLKGLLNPKQPTNNTPHLKSPKNQNRRAALERPAIKSLEFAVDQPSPLVLPWLMRQKKYNESITLQNKTKHPKATNIYFYLFSIF